MFTLRVSVPLLNNFRELFVLESRWNTSIQQAVIRLDGPVASVVEISDVAVVARVMIGVVIARVEGLETAKRMAAIWRDAAAHLHRLPPVAGTAGRRGRIRGECSTALSIQLGSHVPVRQDLIPAGRITPLHLRIQTGPLVWHIMDRAAFHNSKATWELTVDRLS